MKKTITIRKTESKIIITYFDGEFSEWFIKSKDCNTHDERKAIDIIFEILVNDLNRQVKNYLVTIGKSVEELGFGKHFIKV